MSHFLSLQQAFAWLESRYPQTVINPGLVNVQRVADYLKLTEDATWSQTKIITIAGSNGKGSTAAIIERIALEQNISVGLYSSPHIHQFNERIRLNGKNIDDNALLLEFNKLYAIAQQLKVELTYFEFTTLIGLCYFKEQMPEWIILEVGLGGRLDAVNVIDADCAIITTISLEHEQWLGSNLSQILQEKAGIIKAGKKDQIVLLGQGIETLEKQLAQPISSPTHQRLAIDNEIQWSKNSDNLERLESSWELQIQSQVQTQLQIQHSEKLKLTSLSAPNLKGDWQYHNAALAITACAKLGEKSGQLPSIQQINKALQTVTLNGRLEQFNYAQDSSLGGWMDVAHNSQSCQALADFLSDYKENHPDKTLIALFSCLNDKNIAEMVNYFKELIDHWYLVPLNTPRAEKLEKIADKLQSIGVSEGRVKMIEGKATHCEHNEINSDSIVGESVQQIIKEHHNAQVIVFGSFLIVEMFKSYLSHLEEIEEIG